MYVVCVNAGMCVCAYICEVFYVSLQMSKTWRRIFVSFHASVSYVYAAVIYTYMSVGIYVCYYIFTFLSHYTDTYNILYIHICECMLPYLLMQYLWLNFFHLQYMYIHTCTYIYV